MRLQLISVPYRYDEHNEGLGLGPSALLDARLADRLEAAGHATSGPVEATLNLADREEGRTAVNIGKLGASTAALVAAARRAGDAPLVLAGDDTAAVGVIAGLQLVDGAGARIGVVWLDAHGDFNTPETSFSGILAGMPLAIIAGLAGPLWRDAANLTAPVPTDRILLAGIRELDEKEEMLLRSTSAHLVTAAEMASSDAFANNLARLAAKCDAIALHIDLDVLDPRLVPSSTTPAANGLDIAGAAAAISATLASGKVAVVTVSSLNPGGGQRGKTSIQSTLALLEQSLHAWTATPPCIE
jgi:arginase